MFNRTPERIAAEQRRKEAALKKIHDKNEEQLQRDRQRLIRQIEHNKTLADLERIREHEVRYANTITLLGYGGFFALWASHSERMPNHLFGIAGVLISASVLTFIGFEVAKVVATSLAVSKGKQLRLSEAQTVDLVNTKVDKVQSFWLAPFVTSLTTGIAAGGIVLYSFIEKAMNG